MSPERNQILIVEDNVIIRLNWKNILMTAGFDVIEAGSLEKALGLLQKLMLKICAVITDGSLSGESARGERQLEGIEIANEAVRMGIENVFICSSMGKIQGLDPRVRHLSKSEEGIKMARDRCRQKELQL